LYCIGVCCMLLLMGILVDVGILDINAFTLA